MKVSVLTPTYNSEKFIRRCLDSILSQTYDDFECVIVDDASTDNTYHILLEYRDRYPNIFKVFRNDINKGAGGSRKFGLTKCVGEFIAFLDSDDWFDSDYLETMVKKQEETNSDYVNCFIKVEMDEVKSTNHFSSFKTLEYPEGIHYKYAPYAHVFMNIGKMIRKSLFDIIPYSIIRFDEDGTTHFKIAYHANQLCFFKYYGYHYSLNDDSLCHLLNSHRGRFYHCLYGLEMHDFFKDKETSPYGINVNLREIFSLPMYMINKGVDEWKYIPDAQRLIYLVERNKEFLTDDIVENYNRFVRFYNGITLDKPYIVNDDIKDFFSNVYKKHVWGGFRDIDYWSGGGSRDYRVVYQYVHKINQFIFEHNINIVVDFGCGDMNIGEKIMCKRFIGCDVVPELIDRNNEKYRTDPSKEFCICDGISEEIPHGDLLLIKEVFQHLSNEQILKIIENFKNFKYIIITDGTNLKKECNMDVTNMIADSRESFSNFDVTKSPFNVNGEELFKYGKWDVDGLYMRAILVNNNKGDT